MSTYLHKYIDHVFPEPGRINLKSSSQLAIEIPISHHKQPVNMKIISTSLRAMVALSASVMAIPTDTSDLDHVSLDKRDTPGNVSLTYFLPINTTSNPPPHYARSYFVTAHSGKTAKRCTTTSRSEAGPASHFQLVSTRSWVPSASMLEPSAVCKFGYCRTDVSRPVTIS